MECGLDGLVAFVSGAAGGIGISIARALAAEGANLVLHAHTQRESLERQVVASGWDERALVVAGDIRDVIAVDAMFTAARARFGRVDVCIPCAGIWPPQSLPLAHMPVERVREVVEVDLLGAMWTARAFLRELERVGAREDGRGASVCFIGSTAGRFGEAGHAEYAATKGALRALVASLKNEIVALDPYGRVNLVEPGWTVTPMAEASLAEPEVLDGVLASMSLRQLARPDDIARAVLFLSSPHLARHISGEVLTVAGGMEGRQLWRPADIDPAEVARRLLRGG